MGVAPSLEACNTADGRTQHTMRLALPPVPRHIEPQHVCSPTKLQAIVQQACKPHGVHSGCNNLHLTNEGRYYHRHAWLNQWRQAVAQRLPTARVHQHKHIRAGKDAQHCLLLALSEVTEACKHALGTVIIAGWKDSLQPPSHSCPSRPTDSAKGCYAALALTEEQESVWEALRAENAWVAATHTVASGGSLGGLLL